jgi:hypothetical protein
MQDSSFLNSSSDPSSASDSSFFEEHAAGWAALTLLLDDSSEDDAPKHGGSKPGKPNRDFQGAYNRLIENYFQVQRMSKSSVSCTKSIQGVAVTVLNESSATHMQCNRWRIQKQNFGESRNNSRRHVRLLLPPFVRRTVTQHLSLLLHILLLLFVPIGKSWGDGKGQAVLADDPVLNLISVSNSIAEIQCPCRWQNKQQTSSSATIVVMTKVDLETGDDGGVSVCSKGQAGRRIGVACAFPLSQNTSSPTHVVPTTSSYTRHNAWRRACTSRQYSINNLKHPHNEWA